MSTPTVCCICLTADRQRLTDRAVGCFLDQTFPGAHLLIYDTSEPGHAYLPSLYRDYGKRITLVRETAPKRTIGQLRNRACDIAKRSDILVHWDSDDWSAPERLVRQVKELERGPAVGYHNLLFLDTREGNRFAWEYDFLRGSRRQVLGTSLAYWRHTWEDNPFNEAKHNGEDAEFCAHVRPKASNGVAPLGGGPPLLIAEVHGGNSSSVYDVFDSHKPAHQPEWRRAPEWDVFCKERLYP